MILVEYSTDDYGKIMKYISCIKEKASKVEEIIERDTMDHRSRKYRDFDEDEDDDFDRKHYKYNRYK
jgi:hypothetical protein